MGKTQFASDKSLAYVELYAGPGIFDDGNKSTPIRVIEHAVSGRFAPRFQVLLNEMKAEYFASLKQNVEMIPGVSTLPHRPILSNEEVRDDYSRFLEPIREMPALMFVDPWGYKGVSLELFGRFLDDAKIGRDAILFFNYRRITAALGTVDKRREHMERVFGRERAERLSKEIANLHGEEREERVIGAIDEALREIAQYVVRFKFTKRGDNLIFISRHQKGHDVAKRAMAAFSDFDDEGVARFSYNSQPEPDSLQGLLSFAKPPSKLAALREELLRRFSGRTLTFERILAEHGTLPGSTYLDGNYREVLLELEALGQVTMDPARRRKGTLAPHVSIKFP